MASNSSNSSSVFNCFEKSNNRHVISRHLTLVSFLHFTVTDSVKTCNSGKHIVIPPIDEKPSSLRDSLSLTNDFF